jgi:Flp pilus assembly protein TadD
MWPPEVLIAVGDLGSSHQSWAVLHAAAYGSSHLRYEAVAPAAELAQRAPTGNPFDWRVTRGNVSLLAKPVR